ncbi:MAG TPA: hypothetical protein VF771_10885, partial [Longimicrobiaceae bacterium]
IDEGWRTVAPAAAALVAAAPELVLASLSNALHQLAATPGARPAEWMSAMATLAPQCQDSTVFLALGQVAAWRAGMAHFRQGALAAADALPETLALQAVGAGGGRWAEIRERLRADPWFDPAHPEGGFVPRVVARAGAFRGFGGIFTEPPRVGAAGDHFVIASGGECWLLTADAFGATFHRATPGDLAHPQPPGLPEGVAVDGSGVTVHGARCNLPELGEITSAVAIGGTLAITSALTHAVVLISIS